MSVSGLRGPSKASTCQSCGTSHRSHKTICPACVRKEIEQSLPIRKCARCGCDIPNSRRKGSPYCSCQCAADMSRIAQKAGASVGAAILRGELPRLDGSVACADCGRPAKHYEHRDYNKQLDVVQVCQSCNIKRGPVHTFSFDGQKAAA